MAWEMTKLVLRLAVSGFKVLGNRTLNDCISGQRGSNSDLVEL